jgi:hypothetical protein
VAYPSLLVITPLFNDTGADTPTLPIYSVRGATQKLGIIVGSGAGDRALGTVIRRSINGQLVDLTAPQFRKYDSEIDFSDVVMPAIDGAWLGTICEVQCCVELGYPIGGTPQRTEVSGSSRNESGFTFYRPILNMMVYGFLTSFDEWGATYTSGLKMQEV